LNGTALITGASGGLGSAVALELASRKYRLAVHYHTGRNRIEQVTSRLEAETLTCQADLQDKASIEAMFSKVAAWAAGRLDMVVHCAGVTREALTARVSDAEFDRIVGINLRGAFEVVRLSAAIMAPQGKGQIILISSRAALKGGEGLSAYGASKAGVCGLGLSAARELGAAGIRVNVVLPGFIMSDMGKSASEGAKTKARREHLLERFGSPDDVASFIAWLAGAEAVTGQVFNIDGRPV